VLRVLCSTTEQGEYGGAIAVGDRIARLADRVRHGEYGTELDAVEWRLDQDADATGQGAVTISGRVEAISAVYVELTRMGDCAWEPGRGTAHLERLDTTADSRLPGGRIDWSSPSAADSSGITYRSGFEQVEEGDERLSGWVITLTEERIVPT
jgi:hypothetical protein